MPIFTSSLINLERNNYAKCLHVNQETCSPKSRKIVSALLKYFLSSYLLHDIESDNVPIACSPFIKGFT